MSGVFVGAFVVLHGLVHLWYTAMALGLVALTPEMGWTGKSWALTSLLGDPGTRSLAAVLYAVSAVAVVIGGVTVLRGSANRSILLASAALSAAVIVLFWDGNPGHIVEKGLAGLAISLVMVALTIR